MKLRILPLLLLATCGLAPPGCIGGQTGQPTSAQCSPEVIEDENDWQGSPASLAAQAFDGEYTAVLHWFAAQGDQSSPVTFDDALALLVHRTGAPLQVENCRQELLVPVSVEVTTSQSNLATSAEGTLEIEPGASPRHAELHLATDELQLDVQLVEVSGGSSVSGTLAPSSDGAPGGWASF